MSKQLSERPSIHADAVVDDDCALGPYTEVGARTRLSATSMGAYSYIVTDGQAIWSTIGKFCSIAAQVRLNPGNHPTWRASQHHFTYRARQYGLADDDDEEFFQWRRDHWVTLGHDVWIGHGVVVLPGVTVGTGAVLAAGAVVAKDVAPYTIAGGVPAKPLKRRLDETLAERLQALAWWDWSHAELRQALPDFRQLAIPEFLEKYER